MKSQGKTKLGWLLLRQAVQLAQDLGMFRAPPYIALGFGDDATGYAACSHDHCLGGLHHEYVLSSH